VTTADLTRNQLELVLALEAVAEPISGPDLARRLGRHPNTVGNMLDRLVRKGAVVVQHTTPPARGGRPCAHYVARGWRPLWTPRPDVAAAWLTAPVSCEAA